MNKMNYNMNSSFSGYMSKIKQVSCKYNATDYHGKSCLQFIIFEVETGE